MICVFTAAHKSITGKKMNYSDDRFSVDDILEEVTQHHPHDDTSKADADLLIDEILKERTKQSSSVHKSADVPFQLHINYDDDITDIANTEDSVSMPVQNSESLSVSDTPPADKPQTQDYNTNPETDAKAIPSAVSVQPEENAFIETAYHSGLQTESDDAYLRFRENREKKIKGFVLMGNETEVDNEESETDDENAEDKVIEEFDSMEDAPSVLADIKELMTSLSVRLGIMLVLFLMNFYLVLANCVTFLPLPAFINLSLNPAIYVLASTILLSIAMIVSHTTIVGGLVNFCKLKADGDSLPALASLACLVQCVVLLLNPGALSNSSVHLYSFTAVLGLLFNCIGKLLIVKRTMLNFKYVTSDCDKYATTIIDDEQLANDLTKGVLTNIPVTATNKKTGFLTGFLDMSFREDAYDAISRKLTPIIFIAVAILAVSGYIITQNAFVTLTVVVAAFAVCSPLYGLICANLPLLTAVKAVHRHGGMIIGYPAIEEFADVNSTTAQGHDLFPNGTVILHGIKTFKGMRIDDAILDAASILVKANSILSDIFMQVIQGKPELLKEVDTLVYEDMMGISGWVDNKRVLIGTRDLMLNHGIDVPSKDYEKRYCTEDNEIIYLSTSGELTAVFIVSLTASAPVEAALRRLENNNIFLIVKTVDPILNREKLASVFQVEPTLFRVIPSRLHKAYDAQHTPSKQEEGFLANNGNFYSYIKTLTTAKRIKARIMLGIVLILTSVIIGFGLVTALCLMNDFSRINVLFLVGYQALWLIIAWLIQKMRSL